MIVNRVTWTAKRGHRNELVEWFKDPDVWEWEGIPEEVRARATRLYTAHTGAFQSVVLELEFDDLTHYQECWEAISNYNATPERSASMQRFRELTATDGNHELFNLVGSQ